MLQLIPSSLILIYLSVPLITGQSKFETVPLRFDRIIQEWQASYLQWARSLNVPFQADMLFFDIPSIIEGNTTCEKDLQHLYDAASERKTWAMKTIDAWGKPLAPATLKSNQFLLGNYDECIHPLYQTDNKSYVEQPYETHYCKYSRS
jgi:hypothetical protein